MKSEKPKIGVMVLAAGSSNRTKGEPKQSFVFRGKTLLRRAAEAAVRANFEATVIVLGANAERLKKGIDELPVKIAVNKNWNTGISSSIVTGLSVFLNGQFEAVIVTLCDQPLITAENLTKLGDVFTESQKLIVAAKYADTFGVPALFSGEIFDELMNLQKDVGAKKIIGKYKENAVFVSIPEAEIDVDTIEDYERLKNLPILS